MIDSATHTLSKSQSTGSTKYPNNWIDDLPGGVLIWIVFGVEMVTFAMFFMVFAWLSKTEQSLFQSSQTLLHPQWGTVNTLILLSSSWMVAKALQKARQGLSVQIWLSAVVLSGMAFMAIKAWEYKHLFAQGISLSSSNFWFFYLFLTILHNAHVALGVGIMAYLAYQKTPRWSTPAGLQTLEAAAIYWHMVDIIWVILFPLIYFTH